MHHLVRPLVSTFLAAALATVPGLPSAALAKDSTGSRYWVATWTVSPQRALAPLAIDGQTVRQIAHVSLGGTTVRVRLSNAYGAAPLVIGAAHLALSSGGGSIAAGSDRVVTFGGSPTIAIPAGALAVSDPVALVVPDLGDVAVSLFLPDDVVAATQHETALHTTYLSVPGDFTGAATIAGSTTEAYYFLSGIEVLAAKRARGIVALGDSVTDGFRSTVDTNHNYDRAEPGRRRQSAAARLRRDQRRGAVRSRRAGAERRRLCDRPPREY
jgi:hypothetical protein